MYTKHREPQPILLTEMRGHSNTSESASRKTSQTIVQQPPERTRMLLNTSFQIHAASSMTLPILQFKTQRSHTTSQIDAASSITIPDNKAAGNYRFCGACGHPWEPGGLFCGHCGMQRENAN
jgi:NADH pyrophosphatase NudC (nudix superfamily)